MTSEENFAIFLTVARKHVLMRKNKLFIGCGNILTAKYILVLIITAKRSALFIAAKV